MSLTHIEGWLTMTIFYWNYINIRTYMQYWEPIKLNYMYLQRAEIEITSYSDISITQ